MAIEQVPVADIALFCIMLVVVFLIIRYIGAIMMIVSELWSLLPPNDVIARYVATVAIVVFAIYVINHMIIERKPINLDTVVKDNPYFEINKYTVSAFCVCFIIAVVYCVYADDGSSGSGTSSGSFSAAEALFAQAKRGFDPMQFILFAFIFYGFVQMYYMMIWGITPTSMFKA
jgi:hypothetical protein